MGTHFHLMNDGFGRIKEGILLGSQHYFINKFNKTEGLFANVRRINADISQIPRYLMKFMAFGSAVIWIIFFIYKYGNSVTTTFPVLSVYVFASLKLLLALQ